MKNKLDKKDGNKRKKSKVDTVLAETGDTIITDVHWDILVLVCAKNNEDLFLEKLK